jgi:glyoxylase-like metal-dependent hydrolase (beta-lactamase superfamily II)
MTDVAARPNPPGARPHKTEQDPASEEITEVAPGVLRMQLPIWLPGLGHVNMYGLVDSEGVAIVDPGLPGPQSWKALKKRLADAGFRMRDVHTVIVTHSHPDHFGGAGRLAKQSGARLVTHHAFSTWTVKGPSAREALSEGEARRLEHEAAIAAQSLDVEPDEIPTVADIAASDAEAKRTGVIPDDTRDTETTASPWGSPTPWGTINPGPPFKRRVMIRALRLLFTPPEPTQRVHHGEHLRLANRDWQVLHTPGHTVDHLCLFDPETGTLLSGDHVLPTITPHVSGVRRGDSLRSYLATLDLVGALDGVRLGLPAHGIPFDDVPGRVEAIKRHHEERMEMLREASLAIGPATVVDLSHEVFPRKHWGTMAESETFAHLEHLADAGQAEAWSEAGHLYYRVAPKP